MSLKADVVAAVDALKILVDALPDDSTVVELQKKIEELSAQIVALQADLDAKNAILALDESKIEKAKADLA